MITYTITGKTDGFGSQYHAIMSGVALCHRYNLLYIHTPIKSLEHNVKVDEVNTFIGIPTGSIEGCTHSEEFSGEVHYSERPSLFYTPRVVQQLRDWYYSTTKPEIQNIDIAIHIRRGDVTKVDHPGRFTDTSVYVKAIETLRNFYPTYTITIFSEGSIDDFKELGLPAECFRLNVDVKETFHSLVTSKILVMSKSSLSYAAAILNKNSVYYEEFWHKPLDGWLKINILTI